MGILCAALHHKISTGQYLATRENISVALFFSACLNGGKASHPDSCSLPADTQTEIQTIINRPARAMARYLGNHRSRVYLNPAVPFPLTDLFYVLCHEGHPGHLAEFVLKDKFLIQQRGYLEEQVLLPCSPRYVISERLALLAHEMVFAPGEAEARLVDHIYPDAGMYPVSFDLTKIQHAKDILFGVSCNAAWLLSEGRSDNEVLDYLVRYALVNEETARRELASLQQPFSRGNIFTYFHGRRLLSPFLQGPQQKARLYQLLTEQTAPSDL